jgi:GTP-binding protein
MFVDEASVRVRGGRGGGGIIHFLASRHNPRGGPDGGNGAPGGAVVLVASPSMSTLYSFRNRPLFAADNGGSGGENNRAGACGEDRIVHVPVGTVVRDEATGEVLADLALAGDEVVVARGGEGGRGNSSFAGPSRTTPRLCERGLAGESRTLKLELRLIADVGIIGYPNVGKSSLISAVSGKRAKVADYPFTTLVPNLGVVDVDGRNQFVAVDVPGLIDGAHAGRGLGDRFLRHVERTRVLIHVVDVAALDGRDPLEGLRRINAELAAFNPALAERRQIVAGNKCDLLQDTAIEVLQARFAAAGIDLLPISVATMHGVRELVQRAYRTLAEERSRDVVAATATRRRVYRYEGETGFVVSRAADAFVIQGRSVENVAKKLVLSTRDAPEYLADRLERMGALKELRRIGYHDGDPLRIGEVRVELSP